MKIYICGYGVIHFTGKCNCWKKAIGPDQTYIELRDGLDRAKPGTYSVRSHWENGKQILQKEQDHERR